MTPTQFLEHAARLMDERQEVRPINRRLGLSVELRYDEALQEWRWTFGDGFSDYCTDFDALTHIVATWSERVASKGYVIMPSRHAPFCYGREDDDYRDDRQCATYLEALLGAVKATLDSPRGLGSIES